MRTVLLALALTSPLVASHSVLEDGAVALKAGSVHLVDGGVVLTGGATIVIRDGRIEAVGKNIDVPTDARVVDYGPDAVIVPGLIAATSNYGLYGTGTGVASARTADFGVRALDNLDLFAKDPLDDISAGVTSAYIS